jgi:hypothetical protein
MRRWLIRNILPLVFCLLPPLAAVLIAASLPAVGRDFYVNHLTPLDLFMLVLGSALFLMQTVLAWRALQWRGRGFNETPDPWLTHMAQAAEWFPLLGLIGTVVGIMQTFAGFIGTETVVVTQQQVIAKFASAVTATCSGLFMALVNILPTWVVLMGRDLILGLAGDSPSGGAPPAKEPVE